MEYSTKVTEKLCFHCGDTCNDQFIYDSKYFCCEGCKNVYTLLEQNNLCSFYALNTSPGKTLKRHFDEQKFEYLDDEVVQNRLLRFNDGEISSLTLYIPQIHCSSCIYLLENLYKIKDGILRSNVNFSRREVNITFNNKKLSLRKVVELLAQIGYEPEISLSDLEPRQTKSHLRRYYLKIGVAFFAFGNIMLLTFPEYLGIHISNDYSLRKFFGYTNFLLSIPVVIYSAQEFFISAWNALRRFSLNMDVPIVLGIIAMFIRSSYEVFSHTGGGYVDTLASLVLLMLIGRLFQNKTYDTLSFERDYKSYFPVSVCVLQGGMEQNIPLFKLKTGDKIVVRNQELIPADAVIIKGTGNIDYSFVTGESTPVTKREGSLIYAGGKQMGSAIVLEVVKDVSHSYLTQLWNNSIFNKERDDKNLSTMANRVSRWFTPAVLFIA
ncbi:MAG: heavy metal translocating P-type ATPase metal-binding domain-containing protein, partial [Chitinophagales bacterium]|nr:heavy metal translocating P-type ATPase metal-binding domain-containing protein [Chitinophagales bacterium]